MTNSEPNPIEGIAHSSNDSRPADTLPGEDTEGKSLVQLPTDGLNDIVQTGNRVLSFVHKSCPHCGHEILVSGEVADSICAKLRHIANREGLTQLAISDPLERMTHRKEWRNV